MRNPLTFLKQLFTGKPKQIRAKYDAAQTGTQNRNHWSNADDNGPLTANSSEIRGILRRRARYERDNNPVLCGLVKTLAHDLVGSGPRLQISIGQQFYEESRKVENLFAEWARAVELSEKLRLMAEVRPIDGESFAFFTSNPLLENPVQLDLRLMESEQVETPGINRLRTATAANADGIEFDRYGNPAYYHVLDEHPGDGIGLNSSFSRVPARNILHWFRPSRPGQARGVTEFASSLETGAQTRRYSLATLGKAEICANITGVMETEMLVGSEATPEFQTMEEVDIPRMGLMTLPGGFKAKAFEPGNNTTGYKEYIGEKHGELGRPVSAPMNVITGNSSGYNYSSGRLDHVPYHRVVWIERERLRAKVLDRIFKMWYAEAAAIGLIPESLPEIAQWSWDWQWDAFDSIDPSKDAAAWTELLKLKVTTRTEICAARGYRFREVIDTLADEESYMRSKGIDPAAEPAPIPAKAPAEDSQDDAPEVDAGYYDDTPLEPRRRRPAYV